MSKNKKNKNSHRGLGWKTGFNIFNPPPVVRPLILGVAFFLGALIVVFAFFNAAGAAGRLFMEAAFFSIGDVVFIVPLLLCLAGLVFLYFKPQDKKPFFWAFLILVLGSSGILGSLDMMQKKGGWVGFLVVWPLFRIFGLWITEIIFASALILGGVIIFCYFYGSLDLGAKETSPLARGTEIKKSLIRRIFAPKFKVKEISPSVSVSQIPGAKSSTFSSEAKVVFPQFRAKPIGSSKALKIDFVPPPTDLLESDHGAPTAGDIGINSAIIKKTLQNFDIPVEMSEVNIGPTVTQYTLKPAEGIKLSRITALSNDLSLALAVQAIRIEAPIPGRPLVGIEVPNKIRTAVRLRNLIEHPGFQNATENLLFTLGRDTSGNPVFANLARMPHLLVAGATGTGKTVCLNNLIISLLYRNPPEVLRFILIDPKRVEFRIYEDLPHLLSPVIMDAQKTINALKWLVEEMDRRFDVLSAEKARDIAAFNERILSEGGEIMPYIVLIVDELADLMAARGREVEAGIVRLAQMARAVGIHLVVATQRPSVEVITGLIKANITSRISFQVASQVDSRTVLDMAGSEKLLGLGDMLFTSAEIAKPKRIQAGYVTEKEIKKVVNFIIQKNQESEKQRPVFQELQPSSPQMELEVEKTGESEFIFGGEDPLYGQAKKIVVEARKASASLLQRKLRIGYARAARLIDILEERGLVGPGEGAKPREVYIDSGEETDNN